MIAQILAVMRLEIRKSFLSKRGSWVYLLALAPSLIWLLHSITNVQNQDSWRALAKAHAAPTEALKAVHNGATIEELREKLGEPYAQTEFGGRGRGGRNLSVAELRYTDGESDFRFLVRDGIVVRIREQDRCNIPKDSAIFATVFQFFYLRLAIFFGCVGIFANLFRGEMIDKSLHFYLLTPIRREYLMAGKFLAGLLATATIFTTGTLLQFAALSWHYEPGAVSTYLSVSGWHQVLGYLGVTMLGCLGYGSVFLAAGLLVKNPLLPAASVLMWESAVPFLPVAMKKISVIFYLESLSPVVALPPADIPPGLRILLSSAEPTPAAWAITGLFVVTAAILAIAARRAQRLEINYSSD